ncbi:uncharacterized protein VTP21DRAFT_10911 [Calcarisporiella thermophila]|uniref:uncharacterized protein n=1 Tax=Calcarisporiella thermophila TaxID=911321 RepID=UPI003743B62C
MGSAQGWFCVKPPNSGARDSEWLQRSLRLSPSFHRLKPQSRGGQQTKAQASAWEQGCFTACNGSQMMHAGSSFARAGRRRNPRPLHEKPRCRFPLLSVLLCAGQGTRGRALNQTSPGFSGRWRMP